MTPHSPEPARGGGTLDYAARLDTTPRIGRRPSVIVAGATNLPRSRSLGVACTHVSGPQSVAESAHVRRELRDTE